MGPSVQLQALFVRCACPLVIALRLRYPSQPVEGFGAHARRYHIAPGNCLQVRSPLAQITSRVPEEAQGTGHPRSEIHPPSERPRKRSPEVVVFGFQTIQPLHLPRSLELRLGLFGQSEEELGVPTPDCLSFPASV